MRHKRTEIIRYMEPGETMEFPYLDDRDWTTWRSSVAYLNKLYDIWFQVRKKENKILIMRRF